MCGLSAAENRVAVGMDIADHPPRGSVRALLTHTALTSDGCGGEGGQEPFPLPFPGRHGLRSVLSNPNRATAFGTHFSEPYGLLLLIAQAGAGRAQPCVSKNDQGSENSE
jgi:hypothetical protein